MVSADPTQTPAPAPSTGPAPPERTSRAGLALGLVRSARPRQWTKNVLVFAAPAAAGVLDEPRALYETAVAFVAFCLVASGTYLLNDSVDVAADRLHPKKRHRPIAAGTVPIGTARVVGVVLLAAGIGITPLASSGLVVVVGGYVALTVAYSFALKDQPILDLATVAAGFVLRTIAGGVAVGVPISQWFLIVAGSASLFMVAGKRSAEHLELGDEAARHRPALASYTYGFLVYLRAASSSVAILAYCLWAFEKAALNDQPIWYEVSIVPFVLAILRYALLLEHGRGGSPEDLVLGDRTLLALGGLWAAVFGVAVYAG